MEEQIAFFNNANQIVYDYLILMKNNQNILNNLLKDTTFDKMNDTKNIVSYHIDYDNYANNTNYDNYVNNINYVNNFNIELNNNQTNIELNKVIIVDEITYNKFNVIRFNHY